MDPLRRYQIMEPLGKGGQGHTYRAIDRVTGRNVAVKVLALKGQREWKAFDLFEREIAVLKTLDHPNIPAYLDDYASESTGDYFLVMELVEGTPLSENIVAKQRIATNQLRPLLEKILEILEYLHSRSPAVIHRDIKPANLIQDRAGQVHLVDFGGVRAALREDGGSTMIGTFGYMAPEQLHGDATTATDIYGLGATLAALGAGVEAERLPRKGLRIDLEQLSIDQELRVILARMLEPDPEQRLGSVLEVRRAMMTTSHPPGASQGRERQSSASSESDHTALAPAEIRNLANLPAPFSFIVWLMTALASGFLVVVEVILLPLVYQLFIANPRRARRRRRRRRRRREALSQPEAQLEDAQLEAQDAQLARRRFQEVKAAVRQGRRTLQLVAAQTHPIQPAKDVDRDDSN